nr:unnamed protein product [Digitaria exilis]
MLATACGAPPCPCARSRLLPPASIGSSYGSSARVRSTRRRAPRRAAVVRCGLLPVDPWAPTMDSQSVASQLFAVSLFPYLGFLYFMTRSKTAPGLTLFGFYFLLAFVGATKSLLTLTNLFIVLGLRGALRKLEEEDTKESISEASQDSKEKSSV